MGRGDSGGGNGGWDSVGLVGRIYLNRIELNRVESGTETVSRRVVMGELQFNVASMAFDKLMPSGHNRLSEFAQREGAKKAGKEKQEGSASRKSYSSSEKERGGEMDAN